jgi:Cu/Ag efflux protein CusF
MTAITAVLTLLLLFGPDPLIGAKTRDRGQEQQEPNAEQQPVDQVQVEKETGTIRKVDVDKRKLTVRLDNGKTKTFRVDKSVKNLEDFRPGDHVQVSSTEEIVMMADQSAEGRAEAAKYGMVGVSPEGENPAIVKVDTTEVTGRLVSVDPKRRRLTFEDPDGKKETLKLSKRIKDLNQFKPGETLNMAVTDETAIEVIK